MGKTTFGFLTGLLFLSLASCGGATDPLGSGDAGGGGGEGGQGDGGGGGGGDSGVDCAVLQADLDALLAKAQACCPNCNIAQCYNAVAGQCCPVSVTSKDGTATKAYLATLAQMEASCPSMCPAIACEQTPSGQCASNGECR
jgi:hypothetical protein